VLDGIRRFAGRMAQPSPSDLEGIIAWEAASRELGLTDYLGIPAVARGRQLLISLISELEPVAWRGGYPLDDQPRVLTRPAPEITRQEWLSQIAASMVDRGNAALWQPVTGRNASGWPDVSVVLPWDELTVAWADESRLSRRVTWQGRELVVGRDVVLVSLGRRAGDLIGTSPLDAIADSLARILAAELYAGDWFDNSAVPSVVLKYDGTMTDAGADAVKAKWIENHRDHSPAVLPKGWDMSEHGGSPESSQLLQTRQWGALEVARGLGIFPPELLLAELGGSSLTYQNIADALMTFCRVTLQPVYLAPLEEALSDLLPSTQAVRFNTSELERLGTAARFATYQTGIAAGFLTVERVNRWEGWRTDEPPPLPPPLAPTSIASEVNA
jgi:HK97 family phage portal protein